MNRLPTSSQSIQTSDVLEGSVAHSGTVPCARAKVLIVDDDVLVGDAHRRVLAHAGFDVTTQSDPLVVLELLRAGEVFDAIITDIVMPQMDGVALLREIRRYDLDVPVVLMTGQPSLETAVAAVEYGGFRYLTKPAAVEQLSRTISDAVGMHKLARLKREALTLLESHHRQLGDRASLEVHFERALDRLWIALQPIVDWRKRSLFGYEVLVRSDEPTLERPDLILDVAERLGQLWVLGRSIRTLAAERAAQLPADTLIFVNLHALDLGDAHLYDPSAELSRCAKRVVLEVTERTSLDQIRDIPDCMRRLRALGFRIAIDDLGAGYAGLSCFSRLEPDVAKLDMSLIRGIDASKRMQSLVQSMLSVCKRDLGTFVVCEGIETASERDTLESLGAELMQGYLFGRPSRVAAAPTW